MQPLKLNDVNHIITWVNDPEVVKNLQHFNKKFTLKDETGYVNKILKSKNDFVFSFFDNKTKEYIGQGGIHQISWDNKLGRLSIIVKREHWNKGHAKEILPILVNYAFKKLKLHKVWLMHWKENKKASHLYKKIGFKNEGILKDEYYWHNKYHDMVRIAIVNHRK